MSLNPFDYHRAADLRDAIVRLTAPGAVAVAGGTDLLPLWRAGALQPTQVVDLGGLGHANVEAEPGRLVLGALARLSDVARHAEVRARWPLIASAIEASASPQVRNLATVGGNLLQRTRCPYFRSSDLPCNRRQPGSGCGAQEGIHRQAAIFGVSPHCVATHASDLAVALVALEASVLIAGPNGERRLPLAELWRPPGDRPEVETVLTPGELILSVEAVTAPATTAYRKVRDRASFEFAVVSVAAVLSLDQGLIARARLVAGGVGTVPWRLPACEAALLGQPAHSEAFRTAARFAKDGAMPLRDNAFKAELLQQTVIRALAEAAGA
jgi:xanthine dehydrogenase YagS FAD-binding subunit